ncbi:MAG TPA: radical SAM protein, partial [Candidatus Polarisedimenticolia bacterium]|nr:radical SAM protein [Candidatus Polarisedimenticolia bacterium]
MPPGVGLQQLADYHGLELVDRVLDLIGLYPALHISIVDGEPLVRYREFDVLLQTLYSARIEVQLVTSSVGPIPTYRHKLRGLHIVVSID